MPNKISLPQLERSSIEWRKKFRVCFGCITTLCDWLTNSRHFLNQWESKPKPIVFSPHAFSRAWRQLHVFASSSDWFVVLFTSVAIGQSNYFGFGFTHSKKKNNRSNDNLPYLKFESKPHKWLRWVSLTTELNFSFRTAIIKSDWYVKLDREAFGKQCIDALSYTSAHQKCYWCQSFVK